MQAIILKYLACRTFCRQGKACTNLYTFRTQHPGSQQLAVTEAERALRKEIEQAWYNADAAYAKYRAADAAFASAEVAFSYEQAKAEAGRSTVFDFNDAKTRMEKAAAEAVQAKYEFVFRSKILDFYRGEPLRL